MTRAWQLPATAGESDGQVRALACPAAAARTGWALGLLGLGVLLLAGADEVAHDAWAAVGLGLVYAGALVSAFAGALGRRSERVAWLLLAGGLTGYAASAFAYAVDPAAARNFPSVADIGLFVFYPLALAAIPLLVRSSFPGLSLVSGIDMSISAFAVAAVGAFALLPSPLHEVRTEQLSYVLGDLVVLGFLTATLTVAGRRSRTDLRLLGVGTAALAIGDALYLGRVDDGHVAIGWAASLAWPIGVLLLGAAPAVQRGLPSIRPGARTPIALLLLSAAICLPIAIFARHADLAASVLAGLALVAVLVRLSLSLREHERLAQRLSEANAELAHAAVHDPLTGLGNRARLAQVDDGSAPSADAGRALVLVDLDEFKAINDTFGHVAGDRVLQAVGDLLRRTAGPEDLVVRLGGDEFAALLSPGDEPLARALATRFLAALTTPLEIDGKTIFVRASAGVAVAAPGESVTTMMPRADAAMYRAERSDSVEKISVFDPATHHQILENLALAADLRGALARDELLLLYQPIVELASRRPVGFEALVRWRHPEHGLVAPLTFIPLAEQGGLMPEIGQWILEQACREAARWHARSPAAPYVSVNLSVRQLQDVDFLARFHSAVEAAGLPLDKLVVEVTETALATDATIRAPLDELRRLGVRVYIDDFGTGYSSLGYIRDLPLDGVKLDRAFARDLTTSADAWTLAQAIVALLDNLNLALTAEGIESAAQLAQLRSLGCVYAQGYYFSRPQPASALDELLPADAIEAAP
jgi:diguanylate cyclase (GGDEF)-like protein